MHGHEQPPEEFFKGRAEQIEKIQREQIIFKEVGTTVGGLICPLAPFATFFEVAVFVCTVNGTVRFGRLRFNGEDEELGPPAMQQVGDRAG